MMREPIPQSPPPPSPPGKKYFVKNRRQSEENQSAMLLSLCPYIYKVLLCMVINLLILVSINCNVYTDSQV